MDARKVAVSGSSSVSSAVDECPQVVSSVGFARRFRYSESAPFDALIWPHLYAGHLPPYPNGEEVRLDGGLPLGLVQDADYVESVITATNGPLTFLSDGVVEAADSKGELFGFERTRAISGTSPNEIAVAARAWGQDDDITGSLCGGGHDVEIQRNSQCGVEFGQFRRAQAAQETRQHGLRQADQFVAMDAAFVFQSFLDADRDLRTQTIAPRVHRSGGSGGKSGIEQNLAAYNREHPLLLRIRMPRLWLPRLTHQVQIAPAHLFGQPLVFQDVGGFPVQPVRVAVQYLRVAQIARFPG